MHTQKRIETNLQEYRLDETRYYTIFKKEQQQQKEWFWQNCLPVMYRRNDKNRVNECSFL